ncbi:L-tyrosine/L-tryptophan isonitrile synthase family protein [Pseudomonas sp. BIGb0427]|uniref:isocyanide synthase family protein n=1 Tax=unclassified Pseudomonas TaxID=196821 RepID=UPI0018A72E9E|nr:MULTISPECIES: L-tyrosine/L-tryptophan isonitrile synthase family protein [unclassified Pseudomonas]QPG65314.1 L-tyrosine/L-tryptophan isonitrile synthase family protein [Pseudomonas sp. BIGb0427]UVM67754.1 L-tyrosine/L-tryptophan isonitrile synthase family protein [Pseudomonas sp. B21-009]
MQHKDTWIKAVSDVLAGYLLKDNDDRFDAAGRANLAVSLARFYDQQAPVRLVLPGFPCKSPNARDQTFGTMPDYGEAMAIERLDQLGQDIAALHAPGCVVSILSDGTTFNDIVGVPDDLRKAYNQALRELCTTHTINWVSMEDLFPQASSADAVRATLVKQARLPWKNVEALIEQSRPDETLSHAHDKLCSHLYNDLRLCREAGQSEDEHLQQIGYKAYQMMFRGQALNAAVNRFFPDDIRLSVHQYDNAGPKFTVALADGLTRVSSPWHAVPVRHLDGSQTLRGRAEVDVDKHVLVQYQGRPWLYHESTGEALQGFEFELQKRPLFGLVVRDPLGLGFERFSTQLLEALVETFGFVCLRGCRFEDRESFARDCERFGTIYQWAFGKVHVVKPADKPEGVVHSLEKTPLHWDLNMLPDSDAQVQRDPKFCASKFMLYCKTAPQPGEGQTTIVDSRNALRKVGNQVARLWQAVDITYYTRMTYFGGSPRHYSLVDLHPRTGERILRYQEGTDSSLQTLSQEVQGFEAQAQQALLEQLNALVYDDECLIAHDWVEGDLVLIDNYQTLHGRLPMSPASASRELWRVQVY